MKSPLVERYRALTARFPEVLAELEAEIAPGRVLMDLDRAAQDAIERRGYASNFKGHRGYPAFITASLNDEVLNTVPNERRLKEGDLLKLQVGIRGGGAHAYQSWTYAVGQAGDVDRLLIDAGRKALARAVEAARPGPVHALSRALQQTIEAAGFSANRGYVGHAMAENQHEPPPIACFVDPERAGELVRAGQILSIQSIAHAGVSGCRARTDGNVKTNDGKRAVAFSQMVVVAVDGPAEVLLAPRDPYVACGS